MIDHEQRNKKLACSAPPVQAVGAAYLAVDIEEETFVVHHEPFRTVVDK
jgi:hypothetical protein